MPNGNSFSSIARSLNQKSNKAIDGLPDYYPANIPLDFYSPELAVSSNLQMTAEEREELRQEEEAIERQNSTVNQFELLPLLNAEQAFASMMTSTGSLEEKIKTIQEFIETDIWDKEQEIKIKIADQTISSLKISPAYLDIYLNNWQQQVANREELTTEIKEQIKKLCDDSREKLRQLIAKQDSTTFQAIAADTFYIAAKLADGEHFNDLKNRLSYYFDHCPEFKILLGRLFKTFKQFSNKQIDHENLLEIIHNQLDTWVTQRIKEQENLQRTLKKQEEQKQEKLTTSSSSSNTTFYAVATTAMVLASQMGTAAATEVTVNTLPGNADFPAIGQPLPGGYQPLCWTNTVNTTTNMNCANIYPNGTTTATEFQANIRAVPNTPINVLSLPSQNQSAGFFEIKNVYELDSRYLNTSSAVGTEHYAGLASGQGLNPASTLFSNGLVAIGLTDPLSTAFALVTQNQSTLGTTINVVTPDYAYKVAVDKSRSDTFLWCAWQKTTQQIYVRPFATSLAGLGAGPVALSNATATASNPKVVSIDNTRSFASWQEQSAGITEVKGCVVTWNGSTTTATTPVILSTTPASSTVSHTTPALVRCSDGTVAQVFVKTSNGKSQIILNRYQVDGSNNINVVNQDRVLSETTDDCSAPTIALNVASDGIEVAYKVVTQSGSSDIATKEVKLSGLAIDTNFISSITEGGTAVPNLVAIQDGNPLSGITFTVVNPSSSATIEQFNGTDWNPVSSFSQSALQAGNIRAKHDGSEVPYSIEFQASYNATTTQPQQTEIDSYIPVNDPPEVTALFRVSNGQTSNITTSNSTINSMLNGVDPEGSLVTYTVQLLLNAVFSVNGFVQSIFTSQDVAMGYVQISAFNTVTAPSFTIIASDGQNSTTVAVSEANGNLIFDYVVPSPSASSTATPSVTPTPTRTPSVTPTPTRTPSVTPTPTRTPSPSTTPSVTPTVTPSSSVTPTVTPTATASPTMKPSADASKKEKLPTNTIIGGAIGGLGLIAALGLAGFGIFKGISKCNIEKEQRNERLNKSPTGIAAALFDALGLTENEQFDSFKDACDKFYKNFLQTVKDDDTLKSSYGVEDHSDDVSDRNAFVEQIVDYLTSKENFDTYFETEISCSQGRIRRLVSDARGNLAFADNEDDIINGIIGNRPKSTFEIENA